MGMLSRWLGPPSPAEVVKTYGPSVHRHLQRIFGPGADIDDVYQMTFVEILRALPSFEGRSKLSTWIRRITWNVAYQEMRTTYRHRRCIPLDHAPPPCESDGDAETEAAQRQALGRLYRGLEELDPKQRMAVVMHDIEGRTLREISETLGRPLQTVASQLRAGRKRLAEGLKRPDTGPQKARSQEKPA